MLTNHTASQARPGPNTPMTSTPAVLSLDDPRAADAASCGHKAATLAELRQAGFDVPAGFVVPANLAGGMDEAGISAALRQLAGPVAVRSSGLAEDLPDASFAGQYDSFLEVEGFEAVMEAIERCVASANSQRVKAYGGGASVAVLVQQMVKADAAGVAFSANPMTGERAEVLVSATRGLGDRLVAGEVDGDEWSVRDGTATPTGRAQRAIEAGTALRVAELARELEKRFGTPQDIEWALEGERLILLQSRPITVLPVAPEIEVPRGTWQKDTAHYPDPISPFGTVIFPAYDAAILTMIDNWGLLPNAVQIRVIGHEVYTHAEPDDGGKAPPPWWLLGIVARVIPSLRKKLKQAERVMMEDRLVTTPPRWEAEFKPQLMGEIESLESIDLGCMSADELSVHFQDLQQFATRAETIHFDLYAPYLMGVRDLTLVCKELLGWETHEAVALLQGLSVASLAPTRELELIADKARVRPTARTAIGNGGPGFLEALRQVDAELAKDVDRYLKRWGLRTINYDAGSPSLNEQPELVASLLSDLLEHGARWRALEDPRAAKVKEARARLETPQERARFDAALEVAEQVYPQREDNVFYTDNLPNGLFRRWSLEVGRRLTAAGRLLRPEDAALLTAEQLQEALVDHHLDTAAIASRVRGELAWVRANPGPLCYGPEPAKMPDLRGLPEAARRLNETALWAMEEELTPAKTSSDGVISGRPSSPGVAMGPVRVVRSAAEIHRVRQGDIVVCPTTTPAWTVIFQRAAALVTDGGSALCHAAIVAREHGIPAVVATGNATSRLQEGQRVRVDGNRGTVALLEERSSTSELS